MRALIAATVVLGLVFYAQAEVFDVTTIYRYDRPGADPVSFLEIPKFDAESIASCWQDCTWTFKGWVHTKRSVPPGGPMSMSHINNCLSLHGDYGVLKTRLYSSYVTYMSDWGDLDTRSDSWSVKGICVTLDYYITPRSSGIIEIKAVTKEGEMSVGTVTALSDKELPNLWMKKRFIAEINSSFIYLKIVGQNTQKADVYIRNMTGCNEAEIMNTTINRAGSTEIHARNNALGLPFFSQDEFVYYPRAGVDVETCGGHNCTWEATNFTVSSRLPMPLVLTNNYYTNILSGSNYISEFFKFHESTDFLFVTQDTTGDLSIYLTDNQQSIDYSNMYVIRKYGHKSHTLLKCLRNSGQGKIYILHNIRRYCREMNSKNLEISDDKWHINVSYRINVREVDGEIKVTLLNGTHRHLLLSAKDDNQIIITGFRASLTNMDGKLDARFSTGSSMLNSEHVSI